MARVLVFKETLLPPSETFILAQTQSLRRYQHKLAGLELSPKPLPLNNPLLLTAHAGRAAGVRARLYRRTGIAPVFHRRAKAFQPELIHAHFASGGRSAMPLARALGVPLLVTLHGADITVHGAARRYRQLIDQAAGFLCVSEFIRGRALEGGIPAHKLLTHYIGIDRDRFAPAEDAGQQGILFVGRLVEKKGCAYLIRAMVQVQSSHPSAQLTILGDGPLRAELEALARELEVSCTFLGVRSSSEVRETLRRALIFCAPSVTAANGDSEGLPTVLAEALATGIPVVGTRHAGIPEIIDDGSCGFLVEERSVDGLANAIRRLLDDPALRRQFSGASTAHIQQRFDLTTQTSRLEDIYDTICRRRAF